MALTEKYVSAAGAGSHDGSSEANAFSWSEMITDINAGSKAGNRYNVKGNISGGTTAQTISGSGTVTSPVIIRGYTSTIGDGYLGRSFDGTGPLVATNMPVLTYTSSGRLAINGSYVIVETLKIVAAVASAGALTITSGSDSFAIRCIAENSNTSGTTSAMTVSGTRSGALDCDASNLAWSGTGNALTVSGSGARSYGCRLTCTANIGLLISGALTNNANHVIHSCGGFGISVTVTAGQSAIFRNTIVGGSSDGLNLVTSATMGLLVANNLITDNAGYGINGVSASNAIVGAFNRLDRNASGATNLATDWLAATSYDHDTTSVLQAAEYEDFASKDFRLKSTSPAIQAGLFGVDIGSFKYHPAGGGGSSRRLLWTGL